MAFNISERFAMATDPPYERSRFMLLAGISAAELAHRLCFSWDHAARRRALRVA